MAKQIREAGSGHPPEPAFVVDDIVQNSEDIDLSSAELFHGVRVLSNWDAL